jgi:glycerophosphoryl diester phosphodiesterase
VKANQDKVIMMDVEGSHERTAVPLIAHRGASHDAPENTLAAVKLGWERNADAVEIDVHVSKDGRVVVIHDPTTKRTAGRGGEVSGQTLEQLRRLDFGRHKGARWAGERIPTLEEVLRTVPEGKRLFVEIKCGPEILGPLEAALSATRLGAEQVVLIGFDLPTMAAAKHRLPEHRAHWLHVLRQDIQDGSWKPGADELLAKVRRAGLDGLSIQACEAVDRPFVERIHAAGMRLYVWTVDDPMEANRLREAGVDGITTNRPGWLRGKLLPAALP